MKTRTRKVIISSFFLLSLIIGIGLKYTSILVIDTGNDITSIGVKKANAWYSNYQYRKSIVLDEALITGTTTLTNFPVLISMTDTSLRTTGFGGRVTNNSGYDIIFTDTNDVKLDHEIERYVNSTGEIAMWVRIPSLPYNSDTTIYMYYGNGGIGSSQENKTGVWGSNYKGVWHMNDGSNSTIGDSTSYLNTWTKLSTTEPSSATGKIAGGQSWDGSNDYASMADNANISPTTASNSFSAWLYIDTFGGSGENYIKNLLGDEGGGSFSTLWRLGSQGSSTYAQRLGINFNNGSNHDTQNNTNLSSGAWVHIAATTDGTNARWYINGVLDTTLAYTYLPQTVSATWYLGSYGTGSRRYDGIMDEVRMHHATLAADWIQVEYANQNNPGVGAGKFIQSLGSEVPLPVPSVTTSAASNITTTTADLNSSVNGNGEGVTIYYRYGTSNVACSSLPNSVTFGWIPSSSSPNAKNITGLSPDTTYYFCAYATGISTTYGSVLSFTTVASTPTITSPTKTSVTFNSATLGGNITAQGGSAVTARGVCYSTTDSTPTIAEGANCPENGSGTGIFIVNVTGLTPNTPTYYYAAYATNTQGTSYTSTDSFSTPTNYPTGADTNSPSDVYSYYVTLSGVANPNTSSTSGHFRVYSTNPGNCNSDSGGIRYPQSSGNDVSVGADNSPHTFTYTIPANANTFLEPNTQYWYCSFAINTNGTTGGASVVNFATGDGPASPCDPPSTGNLTIPASATCNLNGNFNGVDTGTGTTNTGVLILSSTAQMTIGPSQQVAFGSFQLQKPNSSLVIARGGSLKKGGVFVHDADNDNYLDDTAQYIGTAPPAGYKRRNLISSTFNYAWKIASSGATFDCNPSSQYAYRTIPNLVRDADQDGYKTATAAGPQCVGASAVFNGRTYYNDGSGPN